ncbi:YceK/YidQ family lipoprotein [Pseudomonas nitroreducens]|uniref:YceK/YidQ family lipoprotein n=1 Tax=Pseudomonas TaxID=286 RepID=UPI0007EE4F51|nr:MULTISPECIES: YceK/YidQ family lipoprotein [Pseudomonas]MCE4071125.1 YceK/YidQ family lipoprotein [Pseudomonas nitritireducens]MCE4080992.1 YceK/YidQ family lipoprotein [Pseudomonas nitroreducens]MDG9853403.1 YceK/YidQ family lipoprotein [Pseudomonas nitroreducens]MDH1075437.1 YceK/YidQ family lipoprotein [Pseudomonas nitroreducens]NMZ75401.1 YceK/YidQ family lipoprotein [Pseudomonas nitroreducens]
MLTRLFTTLILTTAIAGCGSVRTLDSDAHESVKELKLGRTYCTEIPRIYSGVAYNFCALHGDPGGSYQRSAGLSPPLPDAPLGLYWPLFDGVLSAATDTLALPYTVYRQQRDGNIELTRD